MRSGQAGAGECGALRKDRREAFRPRLAVSVICGLLLFFLYGMIWGFSAEDSEESGGRSLQLSERLVELVDTVQSGFSGAALGEEAKRSLAEYFEHPIRKFAHFFEYACMGVLLYGIWRPQTKARRRYLGFSVFWVFLSAAADELHQTFVPGRYGSFADVCLDTAGGAFGIWLIWRIVDRLILGRAERKETRMPRCPAKRGKVEKDSAGKGKAGKR